MTFKKSTRTQYTTLDGKRFKNRDDAIAHEKDLHKSPDYIKHLPISKKMSLFKYCSYVVLIIKADLEINNITNFKQGFMGLTQLKKTLDETSLTQGYDLSDTGEQINTMLSKIGLNIYYNSNAEGRNTSLNAIVLDRQNIEIDDYFDITESELMEKVAEVIETPEV